MVSQSDTLPEGTDRIIGGASDDGTAEQIESTVRSTTDRLREEASGLTGKAAAKAREYAEQGKDRATDALDGLSKAVGEVAATVDQNVGAEYGDYARRAADAVAAFSSDLRGKDLDELYADAQKMVRSSPAIAIGTAAAVGFALVRLMRSGAAVASESAKAPQAARSGAAKAAPKAPRKATAKKTPQSKS